MDPSFKQMMVNCNVPESMQNWVDNEGLHDPTAFGLLASCEADITSDIIEVAISGKVVFASIKEKIAVKKLWLAARAAMKSDASSSAAGSSEAPLPKETADDIEDVWKSTHGFTLPENWLLIPQLQGKIWRGLAKKPVILEVLLAEAMRPLSCSERLSAQL